MTQEILTILNDGIDDSITLIREAVKMPATTKGKLLSHEEFTLHKEIGTILYPLIVLTQRRLNEQSLLCEDEEIIEQLQTSSDAMHEVLHQVEAVAHGTIAAPFELLQTMTVAIEKAQQLVNPFSQLNKD